MSGDYHQNLTFENSKRVPLKFENVWQGSPVVGKKDMHAKFIRIIKKNMQRAFHQSLSGKLKRKKK
jgi:hypothetical protein